jgi:hypothetical protein
LLRPTELLIFGNAKGGTPLMQTDQLADALAKAATSTQRRSGSLLHRTIRRRMTAHRVNT